MEKVVLNCATLKETHRVTPAVNVHGVISKVYPGKKFGRSTTQGFTLKDDTAAIFAKVSDEPFTDRHLGCDVEINGANWTSYKGKDGNDVWHLDATRAEVRYTDPSNTERPKPIEKKTHQEFDDAMLATAKKYLHVSADILSDVDLAKKLDVATGLGWTHEDVRTLAMALFIEANKNKGLLR